MSQLVSIVMPLYNAEHYVDQAIRSCLAQTYETFELLVIDDCSSDGSPEIVRSFDDPRIRLIELSKNHGPGPARNAGLDAARGDWLTVLDADDIYHRQRLELLERLASRHGPDCVYIDRETRWELVEEPPSSVTAHHITLDSLTIQALSSREWMIDRWVGRPFFSKELMRRTHARYPAIFAAQDTLFFMRLVGRLDSPIFEHSGKTYLYRRTSGSLVARTPERFRALEEAFELMLDEFGSDEQFAAAAQRRWDKKRAERDVIELKAALMERDIGRAGRLLLRSPRIPGDAVSQAPVWLRARLNLAGRRRKQRRDLP